MRWVRENKWEIDKECRRLSVLESKLIQTFPEDYIVCGNLEKKYEQVGNAVPPLLAEYIGKPLVAFYNAKEEYSKEIIWLNKKLAKSQNNGLYEGLLAWLNSGRGLTRQQRELCSYLIRFNEKLKGGNYDKRKNESLLTNALILLQEQMAFNNDEDFKNYLTEEVGISKEEFDELKLYNPLSLKP